MSAALSYAFFAGMAAAVNPCGFVLLPGLASYYLGLGADGGPEGQLWGSKVARGLLLGLVATAGFVLLFGAVGLAIAAGARALVRFFPLMGFLVGIALAGVGVWSLSARRSFGLASVHKVQLPRRAGLRGVFLYGVGYALASLGCTLPIFLVVVGSSLAARGLGAAALQFVAYSVGMGTVLTVVSVATVLSQTAAVRLFRWGMPYVERAGAALLVGVGAYLVYYWSPFVVATSLARR